MRILSVCYEEKRTGWMLERTRFGKLNLLVGASGVGKTRILNSLRRIHQAATGGRLPEAVSWSIEFELQGAHYSWEVETVSDPQLLAGAPPEITMERLTRGGECLIERNDASFTFYGRSLPKLKPTEPSITLLSEEALIRPIYLGFRRFVMSHPPSANEFDLEIIQRYRVRGRNLDELRTLTDLSIELKGYLLQEFHPREYQRIKDDFFDIFPTVEDVRIEQINVTDINEPAERRSVYLWIMIKERGIGHWIDEISSGMLRTFGHLIEFHLSPPGTVIIIDEFENSLGVNCMPHLTDLMLQRTNEIQFILTSHHPYVINNVPWQYWKLVQRHGGRVKVIDAVDIPALQAGSHHEHFLQLINLPEFEKGIA